MPDSPGLSRREFFRRALAGLLWAGAGLPGCGAYWTQAETYVARVADYSADIASTIRSGLRELGVTAREIRGKRILLKPNLIEPLPGAVHVNTHPAVIHAAFEALMGLGASEIIVAEGPGHCRDTQLVLEESGFIDTLREDRARFVDLNHGDCYSVPNVRRASAHRAFVLPAVLKSVDWIVSMPKMKTHHWAGATLSMKNLFGMMPGIFYGWPKNVLHHKGIHESIVDIAATIRPHFAIVDGIVGMEGDGPIMGSPKQAGVIVMGRNLRAVDATAARIMGINPRKIRYLVEASGSGPILESQILQRGETLPSVRTDFLLLDHIHAQRGLRLG